MSSGKRIKVAIACVTFETVKITDAISYYQPDRVYLIHYVNASSGESAGIYADFYREVVREIVNSSDRGVPEIIEVTEDVSDYSLMLSAVHSIIENENCGEVRPDIYINVSAGSSDFVAAASMVSMMYDNVIPFTVKTRSYTISHEKIRECYYSEDSRPVGMAKEVYKPVAMSKIKIHPPDRELVLALRCVNELLEIDERARASKMIYALKVKGYWMRRFDTEGLNEKSSPHNDLIYFRRDFMDRWISEGWVEKDEFHNIYRLTESGKRILDVFYPTKVYTSHSA